MLLVNFQVLLCEVFELDVVGKSKILVVVKVGRGFNDLHRSFLFSLVRIHLLLFNFLAVVLPEGGCGVECALCEVIVVRVERRGWSRRRFFSEGCFAFDLVVVD